MSQVLVDRRKLEEGKVVHVRIVVGPWKEG